jgi:hypothetical protein
MRQENDDVARERHFLKSLTVVHTPVKMGKKLTYPMYTPWELPRLIILAPGDVLTRW